MGAQLLMSQANPLRPRQDSSGKTLRREDANEAGQ